MTGAGVPSRPPDGPRAGRAPDPGEHPDGDVQPEPHLAGEAGPVGARADPRYAAAPAAARRSLHSKEDQASETTASMRQRMEQHRARPSCAVCHNRLDPLGFGLENYDGVGAWRDKDGGHPGRRLGHAPFGRIVPRAGRAQGDPQGPPARVRPLPDREDAHLRAGPRAG